jgi:ComF family protein
MSKVLGREVFVRVYSIAGTALDGLAAALLSAPCAACGRVSLRAAGGAICADCWHRVAFLTPPLCAVCGAPRPRTSENPARPDGGGPAGCPCDELPASIEVARSVGPYEGTLRSAIHALKYDGRRSVADRLARLAREQCGAVLDRADAVIPVPLHPWRRWTRGFNQSEEIAARLPLPVWRVLRRVRHTAPQASLSEHARMQNVTRAFAPRRFRRDVRVEGACVVLLDDVSTTGATLAACGAVLREMGAREVRALTIARTPRTIVRS